MKYKTLIEKNSEPILTVGRLTPPPPPTPPLCKHHSPPPVSRYRRYRLPTRQRCIYAGQEDRGELEKNACAENISMWCQNMWVSEQLSCCCSCSFSCCMVSLELVVLSPSYIFLTEVVLTRRFHFFVCSRLYPCQWRESWANWVLCGAWRELLHLEALSGRNWQEKKSRGGESHWKSKDLQKKLKQSF